jgi:hypothetical protein
VVTRNDDVPLTLRSLRVLSNGVLEDFVVQHRVDDDPAVSGHPRFPFVGGVLVGVELSDVPPGGWFARVPGTWLSPPLCGEGARQ